MSRLGLLLLLLSSACARSGVFDGRVPPAVALPEPQGPVQPAPGTPQLPEAPSTLRSFVLVLQGSAASPAVGPLALYDSEGVLLRDLAAGLSFGTNFRGVRASVGDRVVTLRGPEQAFGRPFSPATPPGAPFLATEVQVLLRAEDPARKVIRLVGLAVSGKVLFDREIPGDDDGLRLSPRGLFALGSYGAGRFTRVLDLATGGDLVLGQVGGTVIREDDASVISGAAFGKPAEDYLSLLPRGTTTVAPLPAPLLAVTGPGTLLWPQVGTRQGAICQNLGSVSFGQFLYLLKNDGSWVPFGPLKSHSVESLLGFAEGGKRAIFSRNAALQKSTDAPLGTFAFDLESLAIEQLPQKPDPGLFAATRFYAVLSDRLSTWGLRETAPRELMTLAKVSNGWQWGVTGASADGKRVVVSTLWFRGAAPSDYPPKGIVVVDESGSELATAAAGQGELDRTGRILISRPEDPSAAGGLVITSVEHRRAVAIPGRAPALFVYAE